MTLEALKSAIVRLIALRQKTEHTNYAELERINTKLTKLYELKYTMLNQMYN